MGGIAEDLRTVIKVYRIFLVVLYIPVAFIVIWLHLSRRPFNSVVAYNIVVHIGMVDLLCMLTIALAVVISFYEYEFSLRALMITAALFRCVYFVATFSFFLLLAINRLVINEVRSVRGWHYKIVELFIWITVIVVAPLLLHFVGAPNVESEYDYEYGMYISFGADAVTNVEYVLYAANIFVYVVILVQIALKRVSLNQRLRLASPEGRLFLQSVLLFIPQGIAFIALTIIKDTNTILGQFFVFTDSIALVINVVSDFLPPIHLVVLVFCNRAIREAFKKTIRSNNVVVFHVKTVSSVKRNSRRNASNIVTVV